MLLGLSSGQVRWYRVFMVHKVCDHEERESNGYEDIRDMGKEIKMVN